MSDDKLILVGAVGFAVFLVGQKKGWFKGSVSLPGLSLQFPNPAADNGYRASDPGAYVTADDLIKGVTENDWQNMPTTAFDQSIDDLLSPDPMAGFWQPGYYRAIK